MFTIFNKTINGRSHDIYFENFQTAEKFLLSDIDACEKIGFKVTNKKIGFNVCKGFAYYDIFGKTASGVPVSWSLIEATFSDHLVLC